jgi:hypothetical protein
MEIEVETFELTELVTLNPEQDSERVALCQKLNLHESQTKPVFPWEAMTQEEMNIYTYLFPTRDKVRDYSRMTIPLRVLKVLDRAEAANAFVKIEVWYDEARDPLLVGKRRMENGSEYHYLLARWGAALETYATLKERAVQQKTQALTHKRRQALANLEADVLDWANGKANWLYD